MTRRSQIYRQVLQLTQELSAAREHIRQAQMRTRLTGLKLPTQDYALMWDRVNSLQTAIEAARYDVSLTEETAAEKFLAITRVEHPAVFADIAPRAGVETHD